MENGTLDDLYLEWLYKKAVGGTRDANPARSFWQLAKQLYSTRFEWVVPNDDNRAEDGKSLRDEFVAENDIHDIDPDWMDLDCSMLEMLIALAGRASWESSGEPGDWFWHFLRTMEIDQYSDLRYSTHVKAEIAHIVERIIYRKYGRNGAGGLFPLRNAIKDQRTAEIWEQMALYLREGDYINTGP
ncbi:hypothetical protein SEA_MEDIUMFRY_54 [Arthrobacter phage MediumFry]|nr:hypothetical protein SEA_CATERPILLAR_53 [Arthrobacter phage Caterpillar]AXH44600.1 hypothetical protein SEA_MEDIUMFRY_54 [Arthrobacter phage MediumFry]